MSAAQSLVPSDFLVDRNRTTRIALDDETILGRDSGLNSAGVSRRHCVIRFYDRRYYVADIQSTHGTFVNDKRLPPNQWLPLGPQDNLRIGVLNLHLDLAAQDILAPASSVPKTPSRVREVPEGSDGTEQAGYGVRLVASLIDMFIGTLLNRMLLKFAWNQTSSTLLISLASIGLVTVLPMIFTGQTFGKLIMSLKVVTDDGSPLSPWKVVKRELLSKDGLFLVFFVIAGAVKTINGDAAAGLFEFGALVLLLFKLWKDGRPLWDEVCGTRVIRE